MRQSVVTEREELRELRLSLEREKIQLEAAQEPFAIEIYIHYVKAI